MESSPQTAEKAQARRPECREYSGPVVFREHKRVAVALTSRKAVLSAEKEKTEG